ncbi:MAG: acetyltransferase [Isosphaerales bacterium]
MPRDIQPLTLDDLPELSRFLTAGFHAQPEADFASPEVLRWKYLEPLGPMSAASGNQHDDGKEQDLGADAAANSNAPLSYIARNEAGSIIGHLGLCRTAFEGQAIAAHGGRVATIHITDWLGSPDHRSVGMSLMRQAHQGVATQFGLGVSQVALAVGERAGYELRSLVPVYTRVLHAGYWLRTSGLSPMERGLQLARDTARRLTRLPTAPRATVVLQPASAFGPEIAPLVAKAKAHAILTRRDSARLNAFLRFPRQAMSGWHLLDDKGRLRGFAVLNVIPKDQGRTRTGKIVDCLLDDIDVDRWHAAVLALTRELVHQGADLAQAYASTSWTADALRRSGYASRFAVKFHIRDRLGLIPHDAMFHLTPLEGDYAYT